MTDQLIPGDLLHRAKVISGLRQLADWLDAHPDVPVCPFGWDLSIYPQFAETRTAPPRLTGSRPSSASPSLTRPATAGTTSRPAASA
jgi:hypothetical protein